MKRFTGVITCLALLAICAMPAFAQNTDAGQQQDPQKQFTEAEAALTAAMKELEAKPDDTAAIEAAIEAHNTKILAARMANKPDAFYTTYDSLAELTARVIDGNKDNSKVVAAYVTGQQYKISRMEASATEKMAAAEKFKATLEGFDSDDEQVKAAVAGGIQAVTRMAQSISAEVAREEMIGKTATPVPADSDWVNGEPLTPEDLEGKVVFIDFWAVWCGPCIATFPHLREWNEKYADKGLVMIGATKYYSYGWDETAQRATGVQGISKEDERAAMQKFVEHHNLTHRMAVISDNSFSQAYGVTGIPQAVIIDREGKVRMVKVGSGPANAEALGNLLEELFSESGSGDE